MAPSDALLALLAAPLAVVGTVDARSGRIPNGANLAVALLGVGALVLQAPERLPERLGDAAIMAALLLLLRYLYQRRRHQAGLGLGDVKFLAAATLWTGLAAISVVILAASTVALAAAGVMRLQGRRVGRQTRLHFGPYLAGALFATLLVGRLAAG